MKISLIDLKRQYQTIKEESDKAVLDVLNNAQYIMGENVKSFEKEFSEFLGAKNSISVGNGTDALIIALRALGIGEGDEVITTSYTFFATAEAISYVGATPVFVDVDIETYNIDTKLIEEKINNKTKAIIAVHIFGNPCDMDEINKIAKKHSLFVIEDAAQAVAADFKGKKIGTLSDLACFSFFPTKNLGCAGDGGMIVTNNDDLATIVKALRVHGSGENGLKAYNILNNIDEVVEEDKSTDNTVYNPLKYYNYLIGQNSRLDELQAALLRIKLRKLEEWTNNRIENAKLYTEGLKDTNLVTPVTQKDGKHVYHLYILQSEKREELCNFLETKGIATGIYYPVPMHLQKVFKPLAYKEGDCPNAEYLSKRTFALPMFPELKAEEIDYIVNAVKEFN
ncbi:DegT/DnrJ/EryC1/StrS family aminotransferase [Miniphocaeibacter halophilus]|uniref:DegT/DnrJ/EryC1/StrS family aminotransferase n=1 Tax=Miniphocaeibacter halophilus TaxID=2931922 RepID=A0AC61MQN8_9FIRM|nr:DegT/DnrJ/EryC1/StrS family aminotransferase [Miniphocaeibacter halophilus]QQK07927.1 DegT/DnrJ/EryC1/StrS family aminotransferase [Miniphocaeibacter halophilus]